MRIAVVAGKFPAVSETFVLNQITALLDLGHDVDIYASRAGRPPYHGDVSAHNLLDITRYRPSRSLLSGWSRSLATLAAHPVIAMRTSNPLRFGVHALSGRLATSAVPWLDRRGRGSLEYDAVLCHFGPNGATVVRLREAGLFRGPIGTFFHGSDAPETRPKGYDELLQLGDRFFVVNSEIRERLVRWGGAPERVMVHHMGVDLARFPKRRSAPSDSGAISIVTTARLIEIKGIEHAIRAIANLPASLRNRVRYDVIGEGPLRGDLESLAAELGVAERVRFRGTLMQDEVLAALEAAHLFVLPSIVMPDGTGEGMGVAIMEAMAVGVPVVASRSGGIPELVADGERGLLVPPGEAEALADRIVQLVENPAEAMRLAAAARLHVEQHHDNRRQTERALEAIVGA